MQKMIMPHLPGNTAAYRNRATAVFLDYPRTLPITVPEVVSSNKLHALIEERLHHDETINALRVEHRITHYHHHDWRHILRIASALIHGGRLDNFWHGLIWRKIPDPREAIFITAEVERMALAGKVVLWFCLRFASYRCVRDSTVQFINAFVAFHARGATSDR